MSGSGGGGGGGGAAATMRLMQDELRTYQLARRHGLYTQLQRAMTDNSMLFPAFFPALDPRAKALCRTVLLCVGRLRGGEGLPAAARDHIFSFLSFPELAADAPPVVSPLLLHPTTAAAPAAPSAEPQDNASATATSASATAATTPAPEGTGAGTATAAAAASEGTAAGSNPSPSPAPAPAASPQQHQALLAERTAVFALRPPTVPTAPGAASSSAGPPPRETTTVFVRMAHPRRLNEEALNSFFGRYGQVRAEALRHVTLEELLARFAQSPAYFGAYLCGLLECPAASVQVQDFVVELDSARNARAALQHANYRELLFIAPHYAPEWCTGCIADVDFIVMNCLPAFRLLPASAARAAAAAAAAAAGGHRRAHRSRKFRIESASARGSGGNGGSGGGVLGAKRSRSPSPSSSSGSSDGGSDGGSEDTEDTDSSDGEGGPFVPDIVVDGFPFWVTADQLRLRFQAYGAVREVLLAVDEASGAFTGAALVRMATAEEALRVAAGQHGLPAPGAEALAAAAATEYEYASVPRLVAGVLAPNMALVAPEDGTVIRRPPPAALPPLFDVSVNQRLWP